MESCGRQPLFPNRPVLYKENGFKKKEDAEKLIPGLKQRTAPCVQLWKRWSERRKRRIRLCYSTWRSFRTYAPSCLRSVRMRLFPVVQDLYEKKLVTYPRTDARVLSTAVAKEIYKNISGLRSYPQAGEAAQGVLELGTYKNIAKTRYTNDKQITDHYAIIPTGQGLSALKGLSLTAQRVYETIVRRFLSIFYPPAVYQKVSLVTKIAEMNSFFLPLRYY